MRYLHHTQDINIFGKSALQIQRDRIQSLDNNVVTLLLINNQHIMHTFMSSNITPIMHSNPALLLHFATTRPVPALKTST